MLYQITSGTVSVGGKQILDHIDFCIKGKEKIAVVGRNGAGKTTLLRLIAGALEPDRDDKHPEAGVTVSRKLTVGMLDQSPIADGEKTVEEFIQEGCPQTDSFSRERFSYEAEFDRLLTGFGLKKEDKARKLKTFSGGEQTKISFIHLLLMQPDILLLDEPTNHLDIPTVEWLERYMRQYEKAAVFVSHDRFFLDQVVDTVYELEGGKLTRYAGNYTEYRRQKVKRLAIQKKEYEQYEEEKARLEELIVRFKNKPRKAAFARSRKKLLERMEEIKKPAEDDVHIFTGELLPADMGNQWVYEAEHLKIGYDRPLLELSLRIKRGQKIGVIGDNGVGKSTFLKTAAGLIPCLEGKEMLGDRISVGYFDQLSANLRSEGTVLAHFSKRFPGLTEKETRQILASYLFDGKKVSVKVNSLSGGEKARLVLAELLQARPNFLILDEPTNHMDIQVRETLESAFQVYKGTILFVSHDRYFIEQVADSILVFEQGRALYYPFGYTHYIERKQKNTGKDLSAIVQAEDQALIAGMRAVPKAERHRLKEIDTEEAYLDWQLRLCKEAMEAAGAHAEAAYEKKRRLEEHLAESLFMQVQTETMEQEWEKAEAQLQVAEEEWTEACLRWADIWEEIETRHERRA